MENFKWIISLFVVLSILTTCDMFLKEEEDSDPNPPDNNEVFFEGQILAHGPDNKIYIYDGSSDLVNEISSPDSSSQWEALYSQSQDKIYYVSTPTGQWDPWNLNYDIYSMDVDGSNRQQLTFTDYTEWVIRISPNETKILYQALTDDNGESDIWVMDTDGTNQFRVTSTGYFESDPCFSPDGREIIYMSREDDSRFSLWHVSIDGTERYQVLADYTAEEWGWDYAPAWSPDGTKIIFSSRRGPNGSDEGYRDYELWALDLTNDEITQLTDNTSEESWAVWSPSGEQIAYCKQNSNDRYELWIMDRDGSNQRKVSSLEDKGGVYAPFWTEGMYEWNCEVTDLIPIRSDQQVTLYWNKPEDADFDHVEISYGAGDTNQELQESQIIESSIEQVTHEATITGLTNGTEFTFKVVTVDTSGNKSAGEIVYSTPQNDTAAPMVSSMSPTNGATGISTDITDVSITFNESMLQQGFSYSSDLVSISEGEWLDEYTYILRLNTELSSNHLYTIILNPSDHTPGFIDLSGNPLASDTELSFSTEESQSVLPAELLQTWYSSDGVIEIANNNITRTHFCINKDFPIEEVNLDESFIILNFIEYGMYSKVKWLVDNDELTLTFYNFHNTISLARSETGIDGQEIYYSYPIPINDGFYYESDKASLSGTVTLIDEISLTDIAGIVVRLKNNDDPDGIELNYYLEAPGTRSFSYGFVNLPPDIEYELDFSMYKEGSNSSIELGDTDDFFIVTGDNTTDATIPVFTQEELDSVQGTRDMWFAEDIGLVKIQYVHNDGSITIIELTNYDLTESSEYYPLTIGNKWTYERTNPVFLSSPVTETWEYKYDSSDNEYYIDCLSTIASGQFYLVQDSQTLECNGYSTSGSSPEPVMYMSLYYMIDPYPILEYNFTIGNNWISEITKHGSFFGFGNSTIVSNDETITTEAGTFNNTIRIRTDIRWDIQ